INPTTSSPGVSALKNKNLGHNWYWITTIIRNNRVRAVAMRATNGLMRGMDVIDTRTPLSVPVGGATLG
ncbi:hypothetical protein G4B88_027524, partial [Cannabis sativa]